MFEQLTDPTDAVPFAFFLVQRSGAVVAAACPAAACSRRRVCEDWQAVRRSAGQVYGARAE